MSETMLLNELQAPEPSDDTIIARVLNDDLNAFEILMRRYNRYVFAIVSKRVPRAQTPDIVQEVFIQAHKSLPHHYPNTSFKSCLAKIAARRCCDYWRAEKRHPTCVISNLNAEDTEQMEQSLQATACEAAQSEMERERMRETLGWAMDGLEADVQTILWLLYWEDYSPEETAAILGYSPGNVRVRASRARNALRQLVDSPVNILLESTAAPA